MAASVGIVWGICDGIGALDLVMERTPLAWAEPYGDCLTHSRGHFEVWERWRRLGPAGLKRRGLPALIAWHEYERFPRGRVIFHTGIGRFTLYADRRLQTRPAMRKIQRAFGLDPVRCDIRSDAHYQSGCLGSKAVMVSPISVGRLAGSQQP